MPCGGCGDQATHDYEELKRLRTAAAPLRMEGDVPKRSVVFGWERRRSRLSHVSSPIRGPLNGGVVAA